ncbi:MFS transporter, partial [Klebsiella pneumoniae]|uniref:MFS transporter n=1 Tax=Klebsiella pneumoniae TaxID=573 RepID=UPI0020731EEA
QDDKGWDARKRAYCLKIQPATGSFARNLIYSTKPLAVCIGLFFVGFCLNIGWPAFTAYGMAVSDSKTYPIASSIINSGGNLGGFVAPMAAGFLLDKTGSFNSVFTYFGICAAIGLVVILFLDEPQ